MSWFVMNSDIFSFTFIICIIFLVSVILTDTFFFYLFLKPTNLRIISQINSQKSIFKNPIAVHATGEK